MLNLFKMDVRRLFHRKVLYIMMLVLTAIVTSTVALTAPGVNVAAALGVGESIQMDFLASNSGIGFIYMLIGIIVTMFICDDYSSGYAKNIFAVHAKKTDYVFSKLLTMGVAAAVLIVLFVAEMFVLAAVLGKTVIISSIFGVILFVIQKWFMAFAFAALVMLVTLITRNKGLCIVASLLFGSGGLVLGLGIGFGLLGIDGSIVTDSTIFGTTQLISLTPHLFTIARVLLVGATWTAVYSLLGQKVLKAKDV